MTKSADVGFFQEILSNGMIGNSYTRLQSGIICGVGIICLIPTLWGHHEGETTGYALIGIATGMKLVQKPFEAKPDTKEEPKA